MKKALISTNENNRICEVRDTEFDVAFPLYWANCPDDCTTQWIFKNGVFNPPVPTIATAEENKARATALLAETDWVELPSVADSTILPHLTNLEEIKTWRVWLRSIVVNPTAGNLEWTEKPQNIWQTK